MSLLITGVDMPKNGRITIELASEETGTNIIARITDDKTGKLIEHKGAVVIHTPHGDLIDRSELLNQYKPDPEEEHLMKTENPIAYQLMDKIADKVTESINSVKAIIEAEE